MTRLLLARHGETTYNQQGTLQGQIDAPLSTVGRSQAEALSVRLEDEAIDAIHSSDLQRAADTARIIGSAHDIKPSLDAELAEQHLGKWQGEQKTDHRELLERRDRSWVEWTPAGGESWATFSERALSAVASIRERHTASTVLIVGHSGVNKAFLSQAIHSDTSKQGRIEQENACLNDLRYENGQWEVETVNSTTHLPEENR